MKRYIKFAAVIVLCLAVTLSLCVGASAAKAYTNGKFQYTIEDHSVTITLYFGESEEVTVPNMIAGEPVNVIAAGAFSGNDAVKKINLPDTIMSVEVGAFAASQQVIYDCNLPEETQAPVTSVTTTSGGYVPEITSGSQATVEWGGVIIPPVTAETADIGIVSETTHETGDSSDETVPADTAGSDDTTQNAGFFVVDEDIEVMEISDGSAEETTAESKTTKSKEKSDDNALPETVEETTAKTATQENTSETSAKSAAQETTAAVTIVITVPENIVSVSVNDAGNLVGIDESGSETVLDTEKTYMTEQQPDGSVKIVDDKGKEVVTAEETTAAAQSSEPETQPEKSVQESEPFNIVPIIIIILALAAVIALVTVVILIRKRK